MAILKYASTEWRDLWAPSLMKDSSWLHQSFSCMLFDGLIPTPEHQAQWTLFDHLPTPWWDILIARVCRVCCSLRQATFRQCLTALDSTIHNPYKLSRKEGQMARRGPGHTTQIFKKGVPDGEKGAPSNHSPWGMESNTWLIWFWETMACPKSAIHLVRVPSGATWLHEEAKAHRSMRTRHVVGKSLLPTRRTAANKLLKCRCPAVEDLPRKCLIVSPPSSP